MLLSGRRNAIAAAHQERAIEDLMVRGHACKLVRRCGADNVPKAACGPGAAA